jgi:aquaporin Z
MTTLSKKLTVEFVGTFALVFLAVGTAVVGIQTHGTLGVALAFGFVLAFGVYAFGPTSGCHINPAVTIAMVMGRKMEPKEAGAYVGVQCLGAIAGAFVLWLMVEAFDVVDQTGNLGANGYGVPEFGINMAGAFVTETILTVLFVLAVLLATDKAATAALAGVAIGTALAVVHLVGIPLTGTSVNPARSLGPALFSGSEALSQLWLFILAPVLGGVIAALIYPLLRSTELVHTAGSADEI